MKLLLVVALLTTAAVYAAEPADSPPPPDAPLPESPPAPVTKEEWINALRKVLEAFLSTVTTVKRSQQNGDCANYDDDLKRCLDFTNSAALAMNAAVLMYFDKPCPVKAALDEVRIVQAYLSNRWNGNKQYAVVVTDSQNDANFVTTCDDISLKDCSISGGGSISSGAHPIVLKGENTADMSIRYFLAWYEESTESKVDPGSFQQTAETCAGKTDTLGDVTSCFAASKPMRGASCVVEGNEEQEGAYQMATGKKGIPTPTWGHILEMGAAKKRITCLAVLAE